MLDMQVVSSTGEYRLLAVAAGSADVYVGFRQVALDEAQHGSLRVAVLGVGHLGALHARGGDLLRQLWDGLHAIDGVTVFGPDPNSPRTPTVSFVLRDLPAIDVTRALVERGVFTSHGDFYAATVVDRLGKNEQGLVRAGCACYTTPEEVDRLLDGVRRLS